MIDGIRKRLARPIREDPWSPDLELKPDVSPVTELPTDASVLVATSEVVGHYAPADVNAPGYYESLVQTAIENGGKYGGHIIPIPWLRMIQAGLEFKHVDTEMMWYGFEPGVGMDERRSKFPSYGAVFPSDEAA